MMIADSADLLNVYSSYFFQESSEGELEHNARFWIDSLLDRVDHKHAQDKNVLKMLLDGTKNS